MPSARPDRDEVLMTVAAVFATRSTCSRLHVGAVFSRDGRILVTGYNGAPAGTPHCNHDCDCAAKQEATEVSADAHLLYCASLGPCLIAEHAERNAIAWAARHGVRLDGSELHVTHQPCLPCAMSLINAGVVAVHYREDYRLRDGVDLLRSAGVEISQDFGKVVI